MKNQIEQNIINSTSVDMKTTECGTEIRGCVGKIELTLTNHHWYWQDDGRYKCSKCQLKLSSDFSTSLIASLKVKGIHWGNGETINTQVDATFWKKLKLIILEALNG